MSPASAKLLVWAGDQCACVRIITELRRQGCGHFVLDLAECVLMDSTFLGVLAGFGLKLSLGNGSQSKDGIELLNPSARITELLDTLGVLHLFKVTQGSVKLPEQADPREHAPCSPSKDEVTRTCIEAHQTLMEISPANAAKFKDVTQFLTEGLKKHTNA
jgi:anti-sigma B factor antagonist